MKKLPLPKAVLFDLDGTLLDNTQLIIEAYYTGMVILGYEPKNREFIRSLLGRTTFIIGEGLGLKDEDLSKLDAHFWEYFGKYAMDETYFPKVYPGVKDILKLFYRNSIPIGICTSNKATFTKSLIKKVKLDQYVSIYIGEEDVKEKKPSPEPLLLGLERLGLKKSKLKDEKFWYIGDSIPDIEAGHNAGFLVFGVPEKDKYDSVKEKKPDFLFENMLELYNFVLNDMNVN